MRGLIDDVAIFRTFLAEADIITLAGGAAPNTLPAATGILAYWNFNDRPADAQVTIGLSANGKIAYTGVLQQSDSVTGGWSDVSGATTPFSMPRTGAMKYYRTQQ